MGTHRASGAGLSKSVDSNLESAQVQISKVTTSGATKATDLVAREEPLEIRIRGRSFAVTMRTPGHDKELAAGFLLTEGIVRRVSDIIEMAPCLGSDAPENTLNVFLSPQVEVDFERLTRHMFASSSCGLCGKASIESVHQSFPPIKSSLRVKTEVLLSLPDKMKAAQVTFSRTGGLHAAALFDKYGVLVCLREDIGRHNAVDKVIGESLLKGNVALEHSILVVSGRASFEIMQKALAARVPVVAAVSAPSSLAVEFAKESGQTLVGFLRERGMNVYCGNAVRSLSK